MAAKTQLTGGVFQDAEGNLLANGYLLMKLSQDTTISGVGSVCSGIEVKIILNASGSVDTIVPQYIWANDQMLPINTFYKVTGYSSKGQPAWGPNNQQVLGSGGTFDVGTWVPNQMFYWDPSPQQTTLQTDGVNNSDQALLNLVAGPNITLTPSGGDVTISGIPTTLALKTNNVANGSQSILNLKNGTGVTIADDGVGGVTINSSTATPLSGYKPVIVESQYGYGNPVTVTFATPSAGDLILVFSAGANSPFSATYVGFTFVSINSVTGCEAGVFYRFCDGVTDPVAPSVTFSSGTQNLFGYRMTGARGVYPPSSALPASYNNGFNNGAPNTLFNNSINMGAFFTNGLPSLMFQVCQTDTAGTITSSSYRGWTLDHSTFGSGAHPALSLIASSGVTTSFIQPNFAVSNTTANGAWFTFLVYGGA